MKKMILAVMLIAAFAADAIAKDPPQTILRSLPIQYKVFTAEEPFLYDDKRLGASIGYNDGAGIAITVYLYDQGLGDIEEGAGSAIIRAAKNGAIDDIRQAEKMGYYHDVKIVSDKQTDFNLGDGRSLRMLSVSLTYNFTNELSGIKQQLVSSVYMAGLQGYICKIRVSRPADLDKDRQDSIQDILELLLSALKSYRIPAETQPPAAPDAGGGKQQRIKEGAQPSGSLYRK
jgi:hypothetical protein